jgi:endonuclease/exonuclease/phosphatase family metal-dependent hydrolase
MCNSRLCVIVFTICAVGFLESANAASTLRIATYNTSLYRDAGGQLARDLEPGENEQAKRIAEVIQRVRPDVMLINEFDYDPTGNAGELFVTKYLAIGQNGCEPIHFPHHFVAPVNTGRPSGRDLDKNGRLGDPADAVGFGRHEGQYGMLVLSRFPIDRVGVRTFQNFLWRDMPDPMLPTDPKTGRPYYDEADLVQLRLSSKSHWDVPIKVGGSPAVAGSTGGKTLTLHLLCSHPTPPVFDGKEDRNGRRNHDEIRLLADYLDPAKSNYLVDDAGRRGGLAPEARFVILGDLNCDPVDGQGVRGAMKQLLDHPRVNSSVTPTSKGGPLTVKQFPEQFTESRGDPAQVTSNFTAEDHGCLRIDYALPSKGLKVVRSGVFWPAPGEPGAEAITATDHRCVWIDIRPE